jgi:conjugative relaxase-like TrwC/TraI family protein
VRRVVVRVLSSAKIGTSSWRYYVEQAPCRASDYYLGHEQELGRWEGRGLDRLGIQRGSAVTEQQLEALFGRALNPLTGERLGRAWRSDGVTGFDLTFSAPKSVSALTALRDAAGDAGADVPTDVVVREAHAAAVRTALAYLERHAGFSRRGTDGTEQVVTAGFAVAMFEHATSREGDPQLHTHALLLNKARCQDGTWRTLDGHELYAHKKSAGMVYQSVLRNELVARWGVHFEPVTKDGQAEVVGIPERLLEQWSKRARSVNAEATGAITEFEARLGRSLTGDERAAVTKAAVLRTRPDKIHEPTESLSRRWAAEAAALGIDLPELLPAARRTAVTTSAAVQPADDQLAAAALLAAGRSRAVFGRAEVAGQVAALLPSTGLPAEQVLARIEAVTDGALGLAAAVPVDAPVHGPTPRHSDARYATLEVLQAENRLLEAARRGQRAGAGQVTFDQVRQTLSATRTAGIELDRSQVEALLHLTTRGNTLDVLAAPAGAGKTAALGACAHAWHSAGYRVIGLAPSARAAAELQAALVLRPGASQTDTLAKWLHTRTAQPDLDRPGAAGSGRAAWARLDPKTVLVVDEASMASTLDLDHVTQAARVAGAKVVLVGDPGQIGVINGPGGMLATLIRTGHAVALTSIHRFSQQWEKQASLALRDGAADALQPYLHEDRLHPCPDGDTAADALFAHWTQATGLGLDALMLARTRLDVDGLNLRARQAALSEGHVGGEASILGGRAWQHGDLLRARKNDRRLPIADGHVRNGDRYRVLGNSPDGGLLVEDLSGRGRITLPAAYVAKHAEYGWAATIDGSQGATCDVGLLLARPGLDREHLYVGMTRGRHGNHAYLAPDAAQSPDQHLPTGTGRHRDATQLQLACLGMLETALAVSGVQDSATTALDRARTAAAARQRAREAQPGQPATATDTAPVPLKSEEAQRRLVEAQTAITRLRHERQQLAATQRDLHQQRRQLDTELTGLPRWAAARRRSHGQQLADVDSQQHGVTARLASVDRQLDTLAEEIRRHERDDRRAAATTAPDTATPGAAPRTTPGPDSHPLQAARRQPWHPPTKSAPDTPADRQSPQRPDHDRPQPSRRPHPPTGPDLGRSR